MPDNLILIAAGGAAAVLLLMLAVTIASRSMEQKREAKAAAIKPQKKQAGAAVGAFVAIGAAITGVTAIAKNLDRDPPVSREISAGALKGTLLMPDDDDAEMVLILPGSGPTDRDGNNPLVGKPNSYKLLAEALAEEGVASVRVDKRGMGGSIGAGNGNAVSIPVYVDDYHAWIDAIKAETGRKCIWLLGHSEGTVMASAAAEGRKDVCGLILVAGPGRPLGAVLREQLRTNPANAPILDTALAAMAELEAGRKVDVSAMHPALQRLFAPATQDFLISMLPADPVEILRKADKKTLIVQGTTDIQISVEDARLLNRAPRTRLELIEGMNHVLKEAPADRAANVATYSNADLPLAPKLAGHIEDFVEGRD
jgi:pimeloyl-ACP methyl ester carboxylesterase